MSESAIFGVSVRAWLALSATYLGFAFIFAVVFLKDSADIVSVALSAVIGFVNLVLGYYLGQKVSYQNPEVPPDSVTTTTTKLT